MKRVNHEKTSSVLAYCVADIAAGSLWRRWDHLYARSHCNAHTHAHSHCNVIYAHAHPPPPAMSPTPPPTPAAMSSGKVTIGYLFLDPDSITVNVGDTVTWENKDYVPHTVTGAGWDSGYLSLGQTYFRKFDTAGTYNYHCPLHPSMTGTVVVK